MRRLVAIMLTVSLLLSLFTSTGAAQDQVEDYYVEDLKLEELLEGYAPTTEEGTVNSAVYGTELKEQPALEGWIHLEWSNVGYNEVELKWEPIYTENPDGPGQYIPNPAVDRYVVERRNGGQWDVVKESKDDLYYLDVGLPEASFIDYRVYAVDQDGNRTEYAEVTASTFHRDATMIREANGWNIGFFQTKLSGDGSTVAFHSNAPGLPGVEEHEPWNRRGVFVYDVKEKSVQRIGTTTAYTDKSMGDMMAISGDGRYVAFIEVDPQSEGDGFRLVRYDRADGTREMIAEDKDGRFSHITMSSDGTKLSFTSSSEHMVEGDTDETSDVFLALRDEQVGWVLKRVSLRDDNGERQEVDAASWESAISGDGRYVVFTSSDPQMVPTLEGAPTELSRLFLYDITADSLEVVTVTAFGKEVPAERPSISADGRYIAYMTFEDEGTRIALLDRISGETKEVEYLAADGWVYAEDMRLTRDGRYVVLNYLSYSTGPEGAPFRSTNGVVRYDMQNPGTYRSIGKLSDQTYDTVLSANGSLAAFVAATGGEAQFYQLYWVCLDSCGDSEPPPTGEIIKAEALPQRQVHGQPIMESTLTLRAIGDTGQQLQGIVEYRLESESTNRTESVAMSEVSSKVYTGMFTIPQGTVAVERIRVQQVGDPEVFKDAAGYPSAIAGRLRLAVTTSHDEVGLERARLDVWSESKRVGNSAPIVPGVDTVLDLSEADDYVVQIVDRSSKLLYRKQGSAVTSGAETSQSIHLNPPAELRVRVLGEQGEAVQSAQVEFSDAHGQPIYKGKTDQAGWISLKAGLNYSGDEVAVKINAPMPYQSLESQTVMLKAGLNEESFRLTNLLMGEIEGTTTWKGEPVAGVRVRLVRSDNRSAVEAITDAQGRYQFRALAGNYFMTAVRQGQIYLKETSAPYPVIEPGTKLVQPIELTGRGEGFLTVNTWVKQLDGSKRQIPIDDWRAAVDYRLSIISPTSSIDWSRYTYSDKGFRMKASPGDLLQVCIEGGEAGLAGACGDVVLNEQRSGTAELELLEIARIEGSIAGANKASLYSVSVSKNEAGGIKRYIRQYSVDSEGKFFISLPEAGSYSLTVHGPGTTFRMDAEVAESQVLKLAPIQLPGGGSRFTGKAGNGFIAADLYASIGDTVTLQGRYGWTGGTLYNGVLLVEVPAGTELVQESVTLSGVPVTPALGGDGRYSIPLGNITTGKQGTLGYKLKVKEAVQETLLTELSIGYSTQPTTTVEEEWLGGAYIRVSEVTLEAPETSHNGAIRVSGRAPAGRTVAVYADGEPVGWTTATPGGLWYLDLQLPEAGGSSIWNEEMTFELIAKTERNGQESQSDPVMVRVDPAAPLLTKFSMQQLDGRLVTFDPSEGVSRFPYVVVPGMPFQFELEFVNPDRVSNVKVRVGDLEAQAVQQANGTFKATFRAQSGMGTGIFVTYDTVPNSETTRPIPNREAWEQAAAGLPSVWRDAEYKVTDESREGPDQEAVYSPTYRMDLADDKNSAMELRVSAKPVKMSGSKKLYRDVSFSVNRSTGVLTLSAKVAVSALQPEQLQALRSFMDAGQKDSVNTDYIAIALSVANPDATNANAVISLINGLKSYVMDGVGLGDFANDLLNFQDYIADSECHRPTVKAYNDRIKSMYDRAARDLVLKNTLTGLGLVAGVTPMPLPVGTALAIVLTGLGDGLIAKWQEDLSKLKQEFETEKKWRDDMSDAGALERCKSDEDDEDEEEDDDNDNGPKRKKTHKRKVSDPTWIWDPSGYVYEALPHNRVEGVTARILQQNTDHPELWEVWDADWFGQINPLVTDKQGRYGWDVPEGNWRVLFEKEGYLPAQSADLTVLPPHFDVNIPIVSLESPTVSVSNPANSSGIRFTFSKYMIVDTVTKHAVFVEALDGERVEGAIQAMEPEADAEGTILSRHFRFVPTVPLQENESYRLKVLAHVQSYANVAMSGDQEFKVNVVPSSESFDAVGRLDVVAGFKQLLITWEESDTAEYEGLKLYAKPVGESNCSPIVKEVAPGVGYVLLEGLCPSTSYELRLTTVGAEGAESRGVTAVGATAFEEPFIKDTTSPAEVSQVHATGKDNILWIDWKDPDDADLRNIRVSWRKKGHTAYSKPLYVERGEQTVYIPDLQPNTEYELRLVTSDAYSNNSNGVTLLASTKDTNVEEPDRIPPANVSGLALREAETRLTVEWVDPSDADLKELYVSWKKVGNPQFGEPAAVDKGTMRYEISDLTADTEYTVRVVSVDDKGNTSSGVEVRGKTLKPTGGGGGPSQNPGPVNSPPVDNSNKEQVDVTITGDEQEWSGFGGLIKLLIPKGTWSKGHKLSVHRSTVTGSLPKGYNVLGQSFDVQFGELAQGRTLFLTLKLPDSGKPKELDIRKLGIYRKNEKQPGSWDYVGGKVHLGHGTATAVIDQPGTYVLMSYDRSFGDITNHWSRQDVEVLIARHILDGMNPSEFGPDLALTRAQFTKLLVMMLTGGVAAPELAVGSAADPSPFTDVSLDVWYAPYAAYAKKVGLVQGSGGAFRPNDPITRAEMTALIVRAFGLESEALAKAEAMKVGGAVPGFEDGGESADWARGYAEVARLHGLIQGVGGNRFEPQATATRAQGAVILLRAMEKFGWIYEVK